MEFAEMTIVWGPTTALLNVEIVKGIVVIP